MVLTRSQTAAQAKKAENIEPAKEEVAEPKKEVNSLECEFYEWFISVYTYPGYSWPAPTLVCCMWDRQREK